MATSDEEYVRDLLEGYLHDRCAKNARCEVIDNDPPDIVCRVTNESWAIEVTRVNQREVQNGLEKSRTEIDKPILDFGEALGEEFKSSCKFGYTLILNGPPSGMRWSTWKNQVRQTIELFVQTDSLESRDFVGGSISAHNEGHGWTVAVGLRNDTSAPGGHMTCDISANIREMLRHALNDKCGKLSRVSQRFDRVGLVLLNTYFFGDDIKDVADILRTIIFEDQKYSILDTIFYVADRNLHVVYEKPARSPH